MGTSALIALGSNLGDRRAHLDAAVSALSGTPGVEVRAVSTYHGTTPVGGPEGQGAFLNATVLLQVSLDPFALQARLQAIESEQGRTRDVRWGARTLDLDLILFGDEILDTPALTVPHLRMAVRRFVLAPAAEVAPKLVDPLTRRTIAGLLANLDRRPSVLALASSLHRYDSPRAGSTLFLEIRERINVVGGLSLVGATQRGADNITARGLDHQPSPALLEQEQQLLAMQTARWSRLRWGDGWLVFDFWLAETCRRAREHFPEGPPIHELLSIGTGSLLTPTFVVTAGEDADAPLTRLLDDRSTPVLRIRKTTLPTFASQEVPDPRTWESQRIAARCIILDEIAAACAASRGG